MNYPTVLQVNKLLFQVIRERLGRNSQVVSVMVTDCLFLGRRTMVPLTMSPVVKSVSKLLSLPDLF